MKYLEVSYISANFALRKFIDKVDDDKTRFTRAGRTQERAAYVESIGFKNTPLRPLPAGYGLKNSRLGGVSVYLG